METLHGVLWCRHLNCKINGYTPISLVPSPPPARELALGASVSPPGIEFNPSPPTKELDLGPPGTELILWATLHHAVWENTLLHT